MEAVVDEKATAAALWRGNQPDGTPVWETTKDPAICQAILRAVNIREGKTVPALIELPFGSLAGEGK